MWLNPILTACNKQKPSAGHFLKIRHVGSKQAAE